MARSSSGSGTNEKRALEFPQRIRLYDSEIGLENIWLQRLNKAADLRRQISDLLEDWVLCVAEEKFTRWLADELKERRSATVGL